MTWVISAVAFLVLMISILGYRRVSVPRRVGTEDIEDEAVVRAYDRISRWPQFRFLRRMILGELRRHNPAGILVDVGCGPGYLIASIARAFPRLRIIGVDISEEMVEKASKNLSSLGLANQLSFRQGDIQQLPFENSSLDFVVSTLSLHHWSEPKQAIQKINRVLKPGGQFLIFDLRRDSRRIFYWLLRFAQTFVLPAAIRRVNEPTSSVLSAYTPIELKITLSQMPFQHWSIKPGFGWLFVWGRKDETQ